MLRKKTLNIVVFSILLLLTLAPTAMAGIFEAGKEKNISDPMDEFAQGVGFETATGFQLGRTVQVIISAFLSILAIIFVILIIVAGWNWMTAQGEEQKVEKAKDMIKRAIIGLFIIIASYSITYFVFRQFPWFSGGGGAGHPGTFP